MDIPKKQRTLVQCGCIIKDVEIKKRDKYSHGSSKSIVDLDLDVESEAMDGVAKDLAERRRSWQDAWQTTYPWLIYDEESVTLFCKYCKEYPHAKSVYANIGSINFRTSNFKAHARTQCHKDARNAILLGKRAMQEGFNKMHESKEDTLVALFKSAYFVAKENLPFSIFPSLLNLLKDIGAQHWTSLYHDDKSCIEFIQCISKSLMNNTLKKVQESPWFGIMVDESTDIAIHHHMIIYLSYLDSGCMPKVAFYRMVHTNDGTAKALFHTIMSELKKANLDVAKMISFGSDGCSTMIGSKNGVATLLKKVSPMLTSIHCVAHRTNLAVSNAAKKFEYARRIDKMVGAIAVHFNSSSNRMESLRELQEEMDCEVIRLQRIFDIRWLSRHNAIVRLCKSIDAVLAILKVENVMLYAELSCFECIYVLHFLADILQKLTTLSQKFQKDYVDVTTISSIVRNTIISIHDEFLEARTFDMNASQFGREGFLVVPDYGPKGGFLCGLQSSLRGDKLFGQQIERDIYGEDQGRALQFQFNFSKAICNNLEKRFMDNSILGCMKIFVPAQHPIHERLLKDFGIQECDILAKFYGVEKIVDDQLFEPLIDGQKLKQEFRMFKHQACAEWARMSLTDVTAVVASNEMWREAYPNLLCLCQISLVQCCSIAVCERGFSCRTRIKTKWRNRMDANNLDALMRIVLEGPNEMELTEAIALWKSNAQYRHIFS